MTDASSPDLVLVRGITAARGKENSSTGQVAGEGECRITADLTAIDLQVFQHPLNVVSRFVNRDHLDPIDHVDTAAARISIVAQPLADSPGTGIVGGDREAIGASKILNQHFKISTAKQDVIGSVPG